MTGCPHKPKFSYKTTKKSKTVFFRLVTFRVLGQKLYWLYICWIWDTYHLRLCSIEATLAPSTQTAPVRSRADAQNFLCSVGDIAELFPSFSGAIFVKIRPGSSIYQENIFETLRGSVNNYGGVPNQSKRITNFEITKLPSSPFSEVWFSHYSWLSNLFIQVNHCRNFAGAASKKWFKHDLFDLLFTTMYNFEHNFQCDLCLPSNIWCSVKVSFRLIQNKLRTGCRLSFNFDEK